MRGGQVRLKRRLESLNKLAAEGNAGAAGEARLLSSWLNNEDIIAKKKQDDRCKVIVGALVGNMLKSGRSVFLLDKDSLLQELGKFLVRTTEREAILGSDGTGSEAFHRVFGLLEAAD
jgi:hypothetical protein